MMISACIDCGIGFHREPEATWKVRCISCWKATKTPKATPDEELMRWYRKGFEAGAASAQARQAPEPIAFDKDRVRQLLQLCHPDKHGGSDLAQRVTQWLNDIKRRVAV